jgi:transcriptional regulator GlxA family with amidase domain
MTVFTHSDRHHIAVLVRPGVMPMELGLIHQLFTRARSAAGEPLYELVTCAVAPGELVTDADFPIVVSHGPEALEAAQTVIVPAAHPDNEATTADHVPTPVVAALAGIRPGTRLASVCTGAFLLAAAGWLEGRRATTHWQSAERFRALYPDVSLDPDVLYIDEDTVLTSAGEAAGIDLCLHMIRTDHGQSIANQVARATVVPPHRDGGQAQYIRHPVPEPTRSGTGSARAWALEHLDQPVSLAELAAREAMSVRTFTRRFRAETGLSPAQWLISQRLDRARELLEDTDWPVDRIAERAGFGTATSLRQHLQATLGVTPSAYRATFRGPNDIDDHAAQTT